MKKLHAHAQTRFQKDAEVKKWLVFLNWPIRREKRKGQPRSYGFYCVEKIEVDETFSSSRWRQTDVMIDSNDMRHEWCMLQMDC